jgi:hypothetical protein
MLSTVGRFIYTKYRGIYLLLSTMRRFIYTKYWGILCWALCEDLFTQNTEEYFVERCGKIYLHKILIILYVKHCDKIYLHKLLRNTSCWTLGIFIYIKYWGLLYVEHCWKIYLHKILGITLCWTLSEDYLHKIFGNTLCWTLGRCIYIKFWEILYVEHCCST